MLALAGAVVVYAVVGVAVLVGRWAGRWHRRLDVPARRRASSAVGAAWVEPVVRVGAALASLGALLALIAGLGRTALAMAREGDLPALARPPYTRGIACRTAPSSRSASSWSCSC